jgi:hypothetical protein
VTIRYCNRYLQPARLRRTLHLLGCKTQCQSTRAQSRSAVCWRRSILFLLSLAVRYEAFSCCQIIISVCGLAASASRGSGTMPRQFLPEAQRDCKATTPSGFLSDSISLSSSLSPYRSHLQLADRIVDRHAACHSSRAQENKSVHPAS